jgi:hypothetical protein
MDGLSRPSRGLLQLFARLDPKTTTAPPADGRTDAPRCAPSVPPTPAPAQAIRRPPFSVPLGDANSPAHSLLRAPTTSAGSGHRRTVSDMSLVHYVRSTTAGDAILARRRASAAVKRTSDAQRRCSTSRVLCDGERPSIVLFFTSPPSDSPRSRCQSPISRAKRSGALARAASVQSAGKVDHTRSHISATRTSPRSAGSPQLQPRTFCLRVARSPRSLRLALTMLRTLVKPVALPTCRAQLASSEPHCSMYSAMTMARL